VRLGGTQFAHGGHLGDGDVVEHAERADDDARQQHAARVDRHRERVEHRRAVVGVAGEVGHAHEDPRQHAGHHERGERGQQRHRRGGAHAVGEVQRDEGDHRRGDERGEHGLVSVEQRGQQEHHEHDQADRQAREGTGAAPAAEDEDRDDEQHREHQHRGGPLVLVERPGRGAVDGLGGEHLHVVAGGEPLATAGRELLEREHLAGVLAVDHRERGERALGERVVRAGLQLGRHHAGGDGVGVEQGRVGAASIAARPQRDEPHDGEHGARDRGVSQRALDRCGERDGRGPVRVPVRVRAGRGHVRRSPRPPTGR
jgi:hypothetical protein